MPIKIPYKNKQIICFRLMLPHHDSAYEIYLSATGAIISER
jgi:hypothetical protein